RSRQVGMRPDFDQKLNSVLFRMLGSANVSQTQWVNANIDKTLLLNNLDPELFFANTMQSFQSNDSHFFNHLVSIMVQLYDKVFYFCIAPIIMSQHFNFTPGPSQLYFTVEDHMRTAFREGIPSLSHRSKKFDAIYRETTEGLRELLNLPGGYQIFFIGSATEIWERIIQNLVEDRSYHFVNGSFSKRFFEIAQQLGKHPQKAEAAFGQGFPEGADITSNSEVIAVTHNETS